MHLDSNRQYWFYISPKVYVVDNFPMFLYHTESGGRLMVRDETVCELIRQVYAPESMGVIAFPGRCAANPVLEELFALGMAGILPREDGARKPLNFLPILNLQKDVEKAQARDELDLVLDNALQYLSQIHFMLSLPEGASVGQFISQCDDGLSSPSTLSFEQMGKVLAQVQHANLQSVSLYAGSAFSPEYWDRMFKQLLLHPHTYILYIGLADLQEGVAYQLESARNLGLTLKTVIICRPEELILFARFEFDCTQCNVLVTSNEDVELAFIHLNRLKISDYAFTPIYTNSNLSFFQEQVFFSEEELFSRPISMREIFRNQKLNANFFGNMYVMPDGSWRAKPTGEALGNVEHCSAVETVFRELERNTAWRRVRDGAPCVCCSYRYLCPPPSGLEGTLGRVNLCGIRGEVLGSSRRYLCSV